MPNDEDLGQESHYKPVRDSLREASDEYLRMIVKKHGPEYEEVVSRCKKSRAFGQECLSHDDPIFIEIALFVIMLQWRLDKSLVEGIVNVARTSASPRLRTCAIKALGLNWDEALTRDTLTHLLSFLEESQASQDKVMKVNAYDALLAQALNLRIIYRSHSEFIDLRVKHLGNDGFDFDVDPKFITHLKRILSGEIQPPPFLRPNRETRCHA